MISFNYETNFELIEDDYNKWISHIIIKEGFVEGEINYIFCDDDYLHKINLEFLKHDTYTDIITFDNCVGKELNSDIFISIERVKENAITYDVVFDKELQRVMIHGILHLMGLKDKSDNEVTIMRNKEEECIKLFHEEH